MKRRTLRFELIVLKSGSFETYVENQSNKDVHWMCIVQCLALCGLHGPSCKAVVHIHIGVGFGVARSSTLGDARASERGTSDVF